VCQALKGDKLHKTNVKATQVSRAGPHASKESDRERPNYRTSRESASSLYD